jgi:hypothetical protein
MWRSRFLFSAAVAAFLSNASMVHAESHDGSTPTDGARRAATDAPNPRVVDFSVSKFAWDRSSFLERHAALLPNALEAAVSPSKTDEVPIAAVVADLFGTVNDTQLKAALVDAAAEKKRIEEKAESERTPADREYAAFLARLLWAGRLVRLGAEGFEFLDALVPTSPKFPAFEEAFRKAFDRVLANNRRFHELVARIQSAPNEEERRRLQRDLTQQYGSVTAFLDGQVATSEADKTGAKVAEAVAQAIAQKNAAGHTLDLVGAGNTPLRLELGNEPTKFPEVLRQARREFEPLKTGGLASTALAPEPHAGNGVQTFRPGSTSTPTPPRTDPPPRKDTPPRTDPPPTTTTQPFDARMKKVVTEFGGCVDCHGPSEGRLAYFTEEGDLLPGKSAKRLLEVIEGCGVKKSMQDVAKTFREDLAKPDAATERTALVEWARANGFAIDVSPTDRTEEFCRRWQGDGPRVR